MGPSAAIRNGLSKSLSFRGRATRSEFWWFAPLGLIPPIALGASYSWWPVDPRGIWRLGLLFLVSVPLLAAGSRRLQDVGEEGHQIAYPFMPLLMFWIIGVSLFLALHIPVLASWALVLLFLLGLVLLPVYLFALWASVMLAASIVGLLLLPSEPGSNRYDPNPSEATG